MQEFETKCFGETKKSFIILWFLLFTICLFVLFRAVLGFLFFWKFSFFSFRFLWGGWFLLLFCWGGRKFFLSYISRFFKIFRFFCTFFLYICIFFLNLYSKINHGKKLILILFSLNSDLVNLQFFCLVFFSFFPWFDF